jgi:dTDP-4-dehydrorhamnose 3,5-epimerase
MSVRFSKTSLSGVFLVEPDVFRDHRGFLTETFHHRKYADERIDRVFVQDNHSHSKGGVLRGLHYQLKNAQAKLVYVVTGEIFDVVVDIRQGSPTFGQWVGTILSASNRRQIFAPEGFAHGFCVLSETADVIYKCTEFYAPGDDYGIFWADSTIGIDWPIKHPMLSEKDSQNPKLNEVPRDLLPVYKEG